MKDPNLYTTLMFTDSYLSLGVEEMVNLLKYFVLGIVYNVHNYCCKW